jgi:uncharacterized protein YggU (UPF0235/DUF167 family)
VLLAVRVTPRGGRDAVEGWGEDSAGRVFLKVRVRAAPADGEANAAVEAVLAKTLGAPRSAVRVVRGHTGRLKSVEVEGMDMPTIQAALAG